MGEIKVSPDYNWFRSTVPLKKVSTILLQFIVTEADVCMWVRSCALVLCESESYCQIL